MTFLEISNNIDLLYVIDISKDTREQALDEVRHFINKDLPSYNLSPKDTRIGIVTFAATPLTILKMRDGISSPNVQKALESLTTSKENADLSKALAYISTQFDWTNNERSSIPNVVVLFTTGPKGKMSPEILRQINVLKETANVIVVGLGKEISKDELGKLATDKDHVGVVTKPEDLPNLINKVKQATAEATGNSTVLCYFPLEIWQLKPY